MYRIKTVHCSSFSFGLLNDGDVKSVSDESDGEENDGYDAITEVVVVDILVWKLARRYACCTPKPSDLLKKQKKFGEYAGRNFLYFYMYDSFFLRIIQILCIIHVYV